MKKLSGVIIFVAVGLLVFACADDIILKPPPSLVGYYAGSYTYKEGEGASATIMVQSVIFRFDENDQYFMDANPADTADDGIDTVLYDPDVCFCKGRGTYAVEDRVRLDPASDDPLPDNCDVCDPEFNPQGLFSLEQPAGGVKLSQVNTDGAVRVTKILELKRIADPTE